MKESLNYLACNYPKILLKGGETGGYLNYCYLKHFVSQGTLCAKDFVSSVTA